MQELAKLQAKDARDEVRAIRRFLSREQVLRHLRPLGICSEGDEEVGLAVASHQSHRVEVVLLHGSRAAGIGRRQHDATADASLPRREGRIGDGCDELLVELGAKLFLVGADEVETLGFCATVHVDEVLLEEECACVRETAAWFIVAIVHHELSRVELHRSEARVNGGAMISMVLQIRMPSPSAGRKEQHVRQRIDVFVGFRDAIAGLPARPDDDIAIRRR